MSVEEVIALLEKEHPKAQVYVCHFAKRAGQAIPIILPLAEVRRVKDRFSLEDRLCLVEEDDMNRYLAAR